MAGEEIQGKAEGSIGKSENCEQGNFCAQAVADTFGPNSCKLEPSTTQGPDWLPGLQICGAANDGKTPAGKPGDAGNFQRVTPDGKPVDPRSGELKKTEPDPAAEGNFQRVTPDGKPVDPRSGDTKKPDPTPEMKGQQADPHGKPLDLPAGQDDPIAKGMMVQADGTPVKPLDNAAKGQADGSKQRGGTAAKGAGKDQSSGKDGSSQTGSEPVDTPVKPDQQKEHSLTNWERLRSILNRPVEGGKAPKTAELPPLP